MEQHLDYLWRGAAGWWALLALALLQLVILVVKTTRKSVAADQKFPPGPPAGTLWSISWLILGHLPFMAQGLPHQILAHLARDASAGLGPIIGLRLGSKRAVVICNSILAKQALLTHDKTLANSPHFTIADHIFYGYNNSIAFSSYNPRWALLRKLCTLELFSSKRLQALQCLRYEEVRSLLRSLHEGSRSGTQPVDLGQSFSVMLSNTLSRVLHSKTLAEAGGHDYPSLLREQEKEFAPTVGDFLPWLKFLDFPRKRVMKDIHDRTDKIIETMISQRRQLMKSRGANEPLPQDFLQVLLSREANKQPTSIDQDELLHINEIKGTIMDLLSAGIHTTALTLEWAMAELLRNPGCMQKLRAEIDAVIGMDVDHFVTDQDIPKLPYLEKVVKEVFRLHPSLPLLVPHEASEAVKFDRYILPAKTLVFVNLWAIGRDPDEWEDPEEFCPDRFEGKEIDVKGQYYNLLPFGSGRRMCPGLRLALSVLYVTLANLVRTFDWELPNGQTPKDLDMSENRGFTITRLTPLLAIPKWRLPTCRA